MKLPEIKKWSAYIDKQSGSKKSGACVLLSEHGNPEKIGRTHYWRVAFMEFDQEPDLPAHRWETFLVRLEDGSVSIEETETGAMLPLSQWRIQKHPLQKVE
ncbi:MAG: hypothetical protein WAT51_00400 [Holophaga sp.]